MADNEIFSVKKVGDSFEITRGDILLVSKEKIEEVCGVLENNIDTLKQGLKEIKESDLSAELDIKFKTEKDNLQLSLDTHIKDKEEFELKLKEKRYDEIVGPILEDHNNTVAGLTLALKDYDTKIEVVRENAFKQMEVTKQNSEEQLKNDEDMYKKYSILLVE